MKKRVASDEDYRTGACKKLGEEMEEFLRAGDAEELADVIEVIEALKKNCPIIKIPKKSEKKLEERGGFDQK